MIRPGEPVPLFIGLTEVSVLTGVPRSTLHAEAATQGTILNGAVKVAQTSPGSTARRGRLVVPRSTSCSTGWRASDLCHPATPHCIATPTHKTNPQGATQ